jgi:hypothetical protein
MNPLIAVFQVAGRQCSNAQEILSFESLVGIEERAH